MQSFYDSNEALFSMLKEHYSQPDHIYPVTNAFASRIGNPRTIVQETMRELKDVKRERALELGCAVGGGTFELRRYYDEVVGVDYSSVLIEAALEMQRTHSCSATWQPTGYAPQTCYVGLPIDTKVDHITFQQGDAISLSKELGTFDLVLMDKLIDRQRDPAQCLSQMFHFVKKGGHLVVASPYHWSEKYTPKSLWLGNSEEAISRIEAILKPSFILDRYFNGSYLWNSESAWFGWTISQVSIWKRL